MFLSRTRQRIFARTLAVLLSLSICWTQAEVVANWECGFQVEIPDTWLKRDLRERGVRFASDEVKVDIEPFSGITLPNQVARLQKERKAEGYEFKSEKHFSLNDVPCHEMIFYKNGRYTIYYVLMAAQRGFLWTVQSDSTDSTAFLESQAMLATFIITPKQ